MKFPILNDEPMKSPKLSMDEYAEFVDFSLKAAPKRKPNEGMIDIPMFSLTKKGIDRLDSSSSLKAY